MSDKRLYAIHFEARVQSGVWHSHDDLEITGYGAHKAQIFYVAATDECYVKAWWENAIRYWPKEHETKLLKIDELGSLTTIDIG